MRFKMHKVRHAVAPVQGVINDVGHQPGVEACLLERPFQALALDAVVMCAMPVRGLVTGSGCVRLRRGRLGAHYSIFTDRLGTC
jgi:hypothetical protein